jgi:tRNA pseudouridine38-40 synthase
MKAGWENREDEWTFEVQADAFLYRMVRRLVFVQVAVSQGTLAASNIEQSLVGHDKGLHGNVFPSGLAPAQGLTLVEVTY